MANSDILSLHGSDAGDFVADPIGHLVRVHRRHGRDVTFLDGRNDIAFALGPDHNREILTQPDRFLATGFLYPGPKKSAQRRLLSGIFNQNGPRHRDQRRIMRGMFQKSMLDEYVPIISAMCAETFGAWKPGETRDIAADMLALVAQINSRLILGLDDPELVSQLGAATEEWTILNAPLLLAGFLKQDIEADWYDRALDCAERLEKISMRVLEARRDSPTGRDDPISAFLRAHDADSERVSEIDLVGQVAHLFGAANETTRSAFTWMSVLLAQSPDVTRRLQREIRSGSTDGGREAVGERPTTFASRVIKESLRLFPPVAYFTRITAETVELGGRRLPKGTTTVFSHYVTHHMPEIYAFPETFDPDRWLTINPSPYEYLPYGAGPRMCVGAAYASQLIEIALPAFIKRFSLALIPGTRIDRHVSTIITPRTPIPMRLLSPGTYHAPISLAGDINEMVHWSRPEAAAA